MSDYAIWTSCIRGVDSRLRWFDGDRDSSDEKGRRIEHGALGGFENVANSNWTVHACFDYIVVLPLLEQSRPIPRMLTQELLLPVNVVSDRVRDLGLLIWRE